MKKAFVVCCNDAIKKVYLGNDDDAEVFKEKVAKEAFKKEGGNFKNEEEYRGICFWHLHETELVDGETMWSSSEEFTTYMKHIRKAQGL